MFAQSNVDRTLWTPLVTIVSSCGPRAMNGSAHTGSSTTIPTNPCGTCLAAGRCRAEPAADPTRLSTSSSAATAAPASREGRGTGASLGTPLRTQQPTDRFVGALGGAAPGEARGPRQARLDQPLARLPI